MQKVKLSNISATCKLLVYVTRYQTLKKNSDNKKKEKVENGFQSLRIRIYILASNAIYSQFKYKLNI
jgi:hypothetical protein